jgi:hypothetical protein
VLLTLQSKQGAAMVAHRMGRTERHRLLYADGIEVLDYALEVSLVRWIGTSGRNPYLRTRDCWRRAWDRWGDIILPKYIEHRPGRRPAAMYVCGIIPPRPLQLSLSPSQQSRGHFIDNGDGTSATFYDLPEPYQRNETLHLVDLDIVDAEELRRYRQAVAAQRAGERDQYPYEVARYR